MGHRFGYYMMHSHINDVWNKTIGFWQSNHGKIHDQFISENSYYRELKVRHSMSVHLYGTSNGETYKMTFGYHPIENITYISIAIQFSYFGRGFPWMVPQNLMKKWSHEIGIEPVKLLKEKDHTFLEKFNEICNLTSQEIIGQSGNFCPICGNRNTVDTRLCIECGINIEEIQ